jgi:hypothetical protein
MLSVSHSGHHSSSMKPQAGGIMREPMSWRLARRVETKAQMVSWVITWKVQDTKGQREHPAAEDQRTGPARRALAPWVSARFIGCAGAASPSVFGGHDDGDDDQQMAAAESNS